MKRILLTVHKFFPEHRAGTEVLTLKVAQELMRRGYEVLVVTANPPDRDARRVEGADTSTYEYEGVKVLSAEEPLRLRGFTFQHEYFHPGIKRFFAHVLGEFQPDIVHIFHAQNLSASIIEASLERHLPVVCSTTDFWFVCPTVQLVRPNGVVCRGPSAMAANCLGCYTPKLFPQAREFEEALKAKYPRFGRFLDAVPAVLSRSLSSLAFAAYKASKVPGAVCATASRARALQEAANSCAAIMVPTALMKDIFVENGIDSCLIHHVPFGIDTKPLAKFQGKIPARELRFGYIGTLFEHKGVDLLVRAFQSLPPDADALLNIYGDLSQFPEYGEKLKALAKLDCPNSRKISFCGTFPNSELGQVFSQLDVLVVPSRWYENTPLVIQSALASKTPLIATNLGGLSELISHEHNGLLFELNDVNSLKEQMLALLQDRSLLGRLTDNIAPERTVAEMVDDIEAVYRKVSPRPACVVR